MNCATSSKDQQRSGMFYLYQSNRLERLFDELCTVMDRPLSDPLVPEVVVVQNPGTAHWLSLQLAMRKGIAANVHFPLPARFIWQLFASQLDIPEDVRDFNRQFLLWCIYRLLSTGLHDPEFAEIRRYLHDDRDGRKLYQLAGRIADLFDQYLVYRPEMLTGWESGEGRDWQPVLWRGITASAPHHRAGLLRKFREKYRAGMLSRSILPERINVFGISSLAPAYLEIIHAVSAHVDVHLFHLSPCRAYWFDLVSDRDMARKRSTWRRLNLPDVSGYYETGNILLASLGTVGRQFSLQLSELAAHEVELYETPGGETLLAALQRDILDLPVTEEAARPRCKEKHDGSLQFHTCHSRIREVQVLHDKLLDLFGQHSELKPGDILVMAPDIETYDSAIRAVFNNTDPQRFIPWSLADRSVRGELPLAEAFLSLFDLLTGRFEASAVIAFLENKAVLRRFAIAGAEIGTIRTWVRECGIRWGLNSEHRREYGYAMSDLHSWSFGLKRMLMGYMTGDRKEIVHGILPYAGWSSGDSILLGKVAAFFDCLKTWSERLQPGRKPAEWCGVLFELLDDFFAAGNSESDLGGLAEVRETISDWQKNCDGAGVTGAIPLAVVKSHFTETLSRRVEEQPFLSGRVTFCNMVPMRSVPFAVVWLLGMNDTEYPRSQRPAAFDLISRNPATGDRNRRNDDCYLFLEALISARKVFSVSWVGRDQQDNSIRAPSVVVVSLLDYLRKHGYLMVGEHFSPPAVEHPLQPFSPRCFAGDPLTASYAAEWLPGSLSQVPEAFLAAPLPPPENEWYGLDLKQFLRFWSHPVQYFLQARLGVDLRAADELLPDREPFYVDALDRYCLVSEITDVLLKGKDGGDEYPLLQASGRLPHGGFGRIVFEEIRTDAENFVRSQRPLAKDPRDDLEVDLVVDRFHLSGWLTGLYGTGLVRFRPAAVKSRDLLRLWIEHLVYNLLAPAGHELSSYHAATDTIICLRPVDDPETELRHLLDLYEKGLREPLRFYPVTSQACYLALAKGKNFDPVKTWNSNFMYRGEGEDAAYRVAFRGTDPFAHPFAEHAVTVFSPLYGHMEERDAGV